jgi:hypothetical protein
LTAKSSQIRANTWRPSGKSDIVETWVTADKLCFNEKVTVTEDESDKISK